MNSRPFEAFQFFLALFLILVELFKIPGSEPIQLDMEKLFLLTVSKGNLNFREEI